MFAVGADQAGPGSGRRVDLLDELGEAVLIEGAGQVGLGDDADQAVVFDYRQVLAPVVFHLVQHLADAGRGLDPDQRFLGQVTGPDLGWVAAFGDAPQHDVAVGEDAVQPVVGTADRQRADTEIAHLLRGGRHGVARADAFRSRVHDVSRLPGPLRAAWCQGPGMRLRVSVQGGGCAGRRLVCSLPGVLGVARPPQLPDQLAVLPPRLHLRDPYLALRRGVPGLAPGAPGGRLGLVA